MAEKLFGYKGGQHSGHAPVKSPSGAPAPHNAAHLAALAAQNLNNARSLENGLLVVTVVPTVSLLLSCQTEVASCAEAGQDCSVVAFGKMQFVANAVCILLVEIRVDDACLGHAG